MRVEQNVEYPVEEIKEKYQNQTFSNFHSNCYFSLLSDVCMYACYCSIKSDYFITYSTCPCFHVQIRKHRALRTSTSPTSPTFSQVSLLCAHQLHHHICDGTGTKELSAKFLLRDNTVCSLGLKPRHKVYS